MSGEGERPFAELRRGMDANRLAATEVREMMTANRAAMTEVRAMVAEILDVLSRHLETCPTADEDFRDKVLAMAEARR